MDNIKTISYSRKAMSFCLNVIMVIVMPPNVVDASFLPLAILYSSSKRNNNIIEDEKKTTENYYLKYI